MAQTLDLSAEEMSLFVKAPQALPLYVAFAQRVMTEYPDATRIAMKTTIAFDGQFRFAYAGPPFSRMKGWPKVCIVITLLHDTQMKSPRVTRVVEPYPNRWTHHIMIADEAEIDDELMALVALSYAFAHRKGRRGRGKA